MARPWDRSFPLPRSRLSLPGSTRASARDAAERPLRPERRSTRAHLPEAAIDHRDGTSLNEGRSLNPDDNAVVGRAPEPTPIAGSAPSRAAPRNARVLLITYRVPWKGTVPQRVRIPPGKLSLQPVAIGADDGGNDIVRSTSV